MKINQYSLVKKNLQEQADELRYLGFSFDDNLSIKENFHIFLSHIPYDLSVLQADEDSTYKEFYSSKSKHLNENIFYNISLQLLDFTAHFDFKIGEAKEFLKQINLSYIESELSSNADLKEMIYLLLLTRTKNGLTLIEKLVSDDFLPMNNQYHFFNDKSLATFDTSNLIREVVYVESPLDTNNDGKADLIKVQIIRPKFQGKLPAVMTASPYHLGINDKANDQQLHKMEGQLKEKNPSQIRVEDKLPNLPELNLEDAELVDKASETFTHGWTYTLNDYLLARGFASIYVAGVGTRGSDGFMTSGDYQQVYSITSVIDWLNGRARAFTDKSRLYEVKADWSNGNVAMTGKSYLGTLAYGAATTGVEGLKVILAESGITSWYDYYRENGAVSSPGGYPGEDLDVLAALTYSKNLDAADYLKNNDFYQAQLKDMTKEIDRESADYNQYWHDRNYLPHIDEVKADVLAVHGLQDWNVKPSHAYNFFKVLPSHIKKHLFLHQGEHIYINNWQSLDFSETINTYFTAKLLDRKLNLELAPVIWQENNVEQSFKEIDTFGKSDYESFILGKEISTFENEYPKDKLEEYNKDYKIFLQDFYNDKAQATIVDIELKKDLLINGPINLDLKVKINDTKGLLATQILDFGPKKRLNSLASMIAPKEIDLGHNFERDDLKELKLADSPSKVISKALLNLQNRNDILEISSIPKNEWMTFNLELQPTIYQLKAGDTLRILLYSTDFELTIRDNRPVKYEIDLANSYINIPK